MESTKRTKIVVFDEDKIVKAIERALQDVECGICDDSDMDIEARLREVLERLLLENNISIGNDVKLYVINRVIRFIRGDLFKIYLLLINKFYNLKLKVKNEENIKKTLRFLVKQIGKVGFEKTIEMIILKLIDSLKTRRELSMTSF